MLVPKPLLHSTGIQVHCDLLPQLSLSGRHKRHSGYAGVLPYSVRAFVHDIYEYT